MANAIYYLQHMVDSGKYFETKGNNRSPAIDELCKKFGYSLGSAWCALFASYGFWQTEYDDEVDSSNAIRLIKTASSQSMLRWFREHGWTSKDPQALMDWKGALAIRTDPDKVHGHVTVVKARFTTGGKVVAIGTLEGNTGPDQGSHGQGAYEHRRTIPLKPYQWTFCDTSKIVGGQWWK